jgi:hypothetical protein
MIFIPVYVKIDKKIKKLLFFPEKKTEYIILKM